MTAPSGCRRGALMGAPAESDLVRGSAFRQQLDTRSRERSAAAERVSAGHTPALQLQAVAGCCRLL